MDVAKTGKDPSPKKYKSLDQSSSSNDQIDWSNYEIDPEYAQKIKDLLEVSFSS